MGGRPGNKASQNRARVVWLGGGIDLGAGGPIGPTIPEKRAFLPAIRPAEPEKT